MEDNLFKVNRENFTAEKIILNTNAEQGFERDFVLPDYYPDIFRVLKCIVIPKITTYSINGSKLSYEIAVTVKVLYQSENDKRINCIEQKMNFSRSADLSGEISNVTVSIKPRLNYVNCRVVNQRRLDIRGAVSADIKVTGEIKQQVVSDAFGCNIQLKKQMCTYPSKRLSISKKITLIEELELSPAKPSVGSVIRSDCIIYPEEQRMIAGKLIIKGSVEVSMLYSCVNEDGSDGLEKMKFNIPFSQILDIDGIDESFDANTDIDISGCEIIIKGDDCRSLECELILIVNCSAFKYETGEIVTDAYSTCYECELENSEYTMLSPAIKVDESDTAESTISYSDEGISCVYDSWANEDNISSRYDENKKVFIVSGNIKFSVIGRNDSGDPIFIESEMPFEHEINPDESCKNKMSEFNFDVKVVGCSYYLSDNNKVTVKADIKISGRINPVIAKSMLSRLEVHTDKPKSRNENYALKLCRCSGKNDIWEIAKKYSTSISAIMEENELESDSVDINGMLLIPLMN